MSEAMNPKGCDDRFYEVTYKLPVTMRLQAADETAALRLAVNTYQVSVSIIYEPRVWATGRDWIAHGLPEDVRVVEVKEDSSG